jgi:5-methylcytosine-specific restriction enzyme subunit McrC
VINFNRLNERYRHALSLAKLILHSSVLEFHPGTLRASGFLVDMNDVFECFVATALREALGIPAWAWRRRGEGTGVMLDVDGIVGLEPDIS